MVCLNGKRAFYLGQNAVQKPLSPSFLRYSLAHGFGCSGVIDYRMAFMSRGWGSSFISLVFGSRRSDHRTAYLSLATGQGNVDETASVLICMLVTVTEDTNISQDIVGGPNR